MNLIKEKKKKKSFYEYNVKIILLRNRKLTKVGFRLELKQNAG